MTASDATSVHTCPICGDVHPSRRRIEGWPEVVRVAPVGTLAEAVVLTWGDPERAIDRRKAKE